MDGGRRPLLGQNVHLLSFLLQFIRGKTAHLDPSVFVAGQKDENSGYREASAILIDATRKTDYPPTSLPEELWLCYEQ